MLAWIHQSIDAEREFLESPFGLKSDGWMVGLGSIRKFDSKDEEEDWICLWIWLLESYVCL
jgi:conserved oligomeric Golgi complex subunit 6